MHSFPRNLDRCGLTLAAALAVGLVAPAARAQGPKDASTAHINKANELYGLGDRKGSLVEFKRAYALAPHFRMLINIARIELQVEDWRAAYESFRRYLADGGAKVRPERRVEVEGEMKKLLAEHKDAFSGDATPLYSPDPAPAASAPAPALAEPPPPAVTPEPAPKEPAPAPRERPPAPAPATSSVPWAGWAVTGALAVGAGVSGFLALGASSKYDDKLKTFGVSHSDLSDAQGHARALVIVTGVLAAATAASAGITIYLQASQKPGQSSEKERPREAGLRLLIGPGTLGAQGAF